jgi:hypothetical protein
MEHTISKCNITSLLWKECALTCKIKKFHCIWISHFVNIWTTYGMDYCNNKILVNNQQVA